MTSAGRAKPLTHGIPAAGESRMAGATNPPAATQPYRLVRMSRAAAGRRHAD